MQAKDIMNRNVATVTTDATVREVAGKLSSLGFSALPVLDSEGKLVGIVSECDLLGREDPKSNERRDWWLTMFAEGEALNPDFVATLRKPYNRKVHEIMTSPVITVEETTDTAEIAKLLYERKIKRVPVVKDGKIVGVVSRGDLVRIMSEAE